MKIRAKMRLAAITRTTWGSKQAMFDATYDDTIEEDRRFQKATPTAHADFVIDNENVINNLIIGEQYYFDITLCKEETS